MNRWDVDFDQAPLLLIWEITRACALACKHCRAEAIDLRDTGELTLEEGRAMLRDVAAMGTPLVVFTGGDPLQRDDLETLITTAKEVGLRAGTIPATTPRLTRERIQSLKAAGLDQMAMSLDGPTAAKHDAFRQVPGSFDLFMQGTTWAREEAMPLQVNTVFGRWNYNDFDALAQVVDEVGAVFWEVFFLVPTGRGTALRGCTAEQTEALFAKLRDFAQRSSCVVKVTEAPHYRRYLAQHPMVRAQKPHGHGDQPRGHKGLTVTKHGVNSGKGFCFVDHVGDVYPSGFLPIPCGNVRETPVSETYRNHALFRELRDLDRLKGRCGICEYRAICGGSRSRAYALTGDYLAEDDSCLYQPAAHNALSQ
ncbi:MAG: TIGR04053 family radical SAM/SPASM domain-containing protein [Verrucomicrobia bacterium]|nr:TIGR04053 family radical SAM/SPASM domain-containing protein [Verrucomicrobiota bacterium]